MKRACVIGWPIAHSRSPLIHNYWIKKHEVDAIYDKIAVHPKELDSFVVGFRKSGLVGCNVTAPHKEAIFNTVPNVDAATRRLGAVNTIYVKDGNLNGTNTDGEGYLASLRQSHPAYEITGSNVVMIGAGGAAKAIAGALVDAGVAKIGVINRTAGKIASLQKQFGPAIYPISPENYRQMAATCDLLINTTSLGMTGQPPLEFDIANIATAAIVSDIVYSPLETPLLNQARLRGNPTLGGLGMLLHQAVRGFELWFGIRPEVTPELYDLIAADVSGVAT
jgi:shikimate dehydrogenase